MKDSFYYFLLSLRAVLPPPIFHYFHPFPAMLLNECVLDGIISPHHFFVSVIPPDIKGHHKLVYDIPLDAWGFLNAFQPIFMKSNSYYQVFENYRATLTFLFCWRLIGLVLVYVLKTMKILALFPNFFIAVYLAVSMCNFFNIRNVKRVITLSILLFYVRELGLIAVNKELYTF